MEKVFAWLFEMLAHFFIDGVFRRIGALFGGRVKQAKSLKEEQKNG